jgi:hypothetical protein
MMSEKSGISDFEKRISGKSKSQGKSKKVGVLKSLGDGFCGRRILNH